MRSIRTCASAVIACTTVVLTACGGGGPAPGTQGDGGNGSSPSAAATPSGDGSKPKPSKRPVDAAITVKVSGGQVTGVDDVVEVSGGEQVEFVVISDTQDEVHVHGYDETVDVGPGKPAHVSFTAQIPGAFEVELEEAGLELFELRVQ